MCLERHTIDVLVTDLNLARDNGLLLCRSALVQDPELPVVIITAFGSMDTAIEAIRAGAYDFLTKPLSLNSLALVVNRAAKLRAIKHEVAALRVEVRQRGREARLHGTSSPMARLRHTISAVATTDATVMVLGESGVGKERVAREIHALSRRADRPFVAENVAAIPAELLESTLFGHVRGAFTGATGARKGLFRQAHGGTLLLDEIGELPLALQPKLLRALEERAVRPVGSDSLCPIDVRLLAATHQDLSAAVGRGAFRKDLFYRLAVVDLAVPPLRERRGDILLLAQLFIGEHAARMERPVQGLHHETAALLLGWSWPGNVRELRNAMERAVVMASSKLILPSDLPLQIQAADPVLPRPEGARRDWRMTLEEVERDHILRVLREVGGNKAEAARSLGIGRKTLYRKLECWGLSNSEPK